MQHGVKPKVFLIAVTCAANFSQNRLQGQGGQNMVENWNSPDLLGDTLRRQRSKQAGVCSTNTLQNVKLGGSENVEAGEKIRSNQFPLLPNGGQSVAPSAINLSSRHVEKNKTKVRDF